MSGGEGGTNQGSSEDELLSSDLQKQEVSEVKRVESSERLHIPKSEGKNEHHSILVAIENVATLRKEFRTQTEAAGGARRTSVEPVRILGHHDENELSRQDVEEADWLEEEEAVRIV